MSARQAVVKLGERFAGVENAVHQSARRFYGNRRNARLFPASAVLIDEPVELRPDVVAADLLVGRLSEFVEFPAVAYQRSPSITHEQLRDRVWFPGSTSYVLARPSSSMRRVMSSVIRSTSATPRLIDQHE